MPNRATKSSPGGPKRPSSNSNRLAKHQAVIVEVTEDTSSADDDFRPKIQRSPSDYTPLGGRDPSSSRSWRKQRQSRIREDLSSDDESGTGAPPDAPAPITCRQWVILGILMFATLTSSFAVCLFPPFFPRVAEEKGASATVYGFIIGTNCLTSFIVTPIIGKNLNTIGVRFAMICGMFTGGVCCGLSGFLEFYGPGVEFIVIAILLRVLHATGNAMVITSTFTYTAMEFQNAVGKIFSLTRTAMNLAQLFGPIVGGAIYQVGGFHMPFISMGCLQIIMASASGFFLPEYDEPQEERRRRTKRVTICNMLQIPTIWFSFGTFIVATVCNGFLSINLEPQVLRKFSLTPLYVGIIFGLKDGANSLASPVWGYLCDKSRKTSVKPYIIVSASFVAASFFFLGADHVIGAPIKLTLPLVIAALCLNGIGIGGEQVSGVVDALHEAVNAGYPDDPNMHGLIAGLWSSLSGAGRFVSRAGSGVLVDYVGFDNTAMVVTSLQAIIIVVTFLYVVFCECTLKNQTPVRPFDDVTIISRSTSDEIVFTETASPSESVMGKTVSLDVPSGRKHPRMATSAPMKARRGLISDWYGPASFE